METSYTAGGLTERSNSPNGMVVRTEFDRVSPAEATSTTVGSQAIFQLHSVLWREVCSASRSVCAIERTSYWARHLMVRYSQASGRCNRIL